MYVVVVERVVTGQGTIETGLEESGPRIFEHQLAAAQVVLAQSGHTRVHRLAAVHVLDGRFPKEEVHELVDLERANELGRVEPLGVVLHRPQSPRSRLAVRQRQPIDGVVLAGEVGRRSDVQVGATSGSRRQQTADPAVRAVRAPVNEAEKRASLNTLLVSSKVGRKHWTSASKKG